MVTAGKPFTQGWVSPQFLHHANDPRGILKILAKRF
jgi:hypothetical protein